MREEDSTGSTSRRQFLKKSLALSSLLVAPGRALAQGPEPAPPADLPASGAARPNILWISSENHGPQMGCYGDTYAITPNVDQLAAKGMLYLHAWSAAPVCAHMKQAVPRFCENT